MTSSTVTPKSYTQTETYTGANTTIVKKREKASTTLQQVQNLKDCGRITTLYEEKWYTLMVPFMKANCLAKQNAMGRGFTSTATAIFTMVSGSMARNMVTGECLPPSKLTKAVGRTTYNTAEESSLTI